MLLNLANLSALFTSYSSAFKNGLSKAQPSWSQVATLVPSSTESNLYAWLGQFPRLRQWLGDRIVKDMMTYNYTVANLPFESTISVPRPKMEDDTYGIFTPLMEEMGYGAAIHPDELIYALALLGHTQLCYDGQGFVDTDHPIMVNGVASTASNYDAVGAGALWYLLDTSRPIKPFIFQKRQDYKFQAFNKMEDEYVFRTNTFLYGVDARVNVGFGLWQLAYGSLNTINATNFDLYYAAMMGRMSDEGKPLGVRPNLLLCGPSNRAAARTLIETQILANGATNPNYKMVDILVSPYLV